MRKVFRAVCYRLVSAWILLVFWLCLAVVIGAILFPEFSILAYIGVMSFDQAFTVWVLTAIYLAAICLVFLLVGE